MPRKSMSKDSAELSAAKQPDVNVGRAVQEHVDSLQELTHNVNVKVDHLMTAQQELMREYQLRRASLESGLAKLDTKGWRHSRLSA